MIVFNNRIMQGCEPLFALDIEVKVSLTLLEIILVVSSGKLKRLKLVFLNGNMKRRQTVIIDQVDVNTLPDQADC
jgi:hypothetical protein